MRELGEAFSKFELVAIIELIIALFLNFWLNLLTNTISNNSQTRKLQQQHQELIQALQELKLNTQYTKEIHEKVFEKK